MDFYKIVKETLDKLHVRVPFEIDHLTEKEEKYLHMLINCILHHRTISFKGNSDIRPVCTLKIANLRIVLAFYLNEDGKYKIEDFFSTELYCSLEDDIKSRTSPFCILKKDDYLQDSNLVLETAKELCLWLTGKKPNDIIPRLNYLQCCKRERSLDDTEIDELTNMLLDNAADDSALAGIHILLDSKIMAKKYMDKLDANRREEFENYPIYALYKK